MLFSKDHLYTLTRYGYNQLDKYDLKGNLVWSRTYAATKELPELSFGNLSVDPAGNVTIVGSYEIAYLNPGAVIRKVSATGKTLWTKTPENLRGAYLSSVGNRDNGGSIYIGGGIANYSGVGDYGSLVSRLDRGGNEDWTIR